MKRLLLGIGNILMGDDGIGVHVARALQREKDQLGVDVEDGGTGGFSLLEFIEPYEEILVVDAAGLGMPAGSVARVSPELLGARRAWSGHDHGLVDVLRLLEAIQSDKTIRIIGVQPSSLAQSDNISPEMRAAFDSILDAVRLEATTAWESKGVRRHDRHFRSSTNVPL